jgi:hypothetical protein
MKHILFFIIMLTPLISSAQETGRYYLLEPDSKDQYTDSFAHLQQTGYRLWVFNDSVRLYIADPFKFAQAMRGRGNILLTHRNGQVKYSSGQLRRLLQDSYLESFHWKSRRFTRDRKRSFHQVWKGKKKDLNTERALYIPLPVSDQPALDWYLSFRQGRKNFASLVFREEIVR